MSKVSLLKNMRKTVLVPFMAFAMLFGGMFLNLGSVSATGDTTPPSFPSCLSQTGNGDKAHYASGLHQIVGNGLLEGQDDVYTLSNGNFLQCFVPPDKKVCIQTNWWRTDLELAGWFSVNGSQWNLGDLHYLAQNINYNCVPEPSPSPSPTPTPTSSPTATPTTIVINNHQEQKQEQNNNQTVNITTAGTTSGRVAGVKTPVKTPETGVSALALTSMFGAGPVGFALMRFGRGRFGSQKKEESLSEAALGLFNKRSGQA